MPASPVSTVGGVPAKAPPPGIPAKVPPQSPPAKASTPLGSMQQGPGMPDQRRLGMQASTPASPAST
eukprot:11371736-Alexandrium_andersonii.AAC.1